MDGFSRSSITSLCSSISNRGTACYHEVDSLVNGTARINGEVWDLVALAGLAREAAGNLTRLEEILHNTRVLSERLQASMNQELPLCEAIFARLHKQLCRLDPNNAGTVDENYVHIHQAVMATHSRLFELYIEILSLCVSLHWAGPFG